MKKIIQSLILIVSLLVIVSCAIPREHDEILSKLEITYATSDSENSVTQDITFKNEAYKNYTITWSSNNEAIKIEGNKGIVTRLDYDVDVTITVRVATTLEFKEKTFTLTVKALVVEVDLEEILDSISIQYSGNDTKDSITQDITLPNAAINGVTVSWTSNHAAIKIEGNKGVVTRTSSDATVILTVTVSKDSKEAKADFTVIVKAQDATQPTDQEKLDAAKAALSITQTNVTENFELPLTGLNNTTVTWSSNNEAIEIDGANAIVTRGTEDVTVTLTATITLNDATATKTFEVTVKAEEVIVIDLETIVESIAITFADENDEDNVTANLVLPNDDVQGVTITWASDNDAIKVEGSTGVVKRSLLDVTVTLTVTATLDGESKTATHEVVVKGIEATDIVDVYDLANDAIVTIQGVVTGVAGNNAVAIQDDTAAITIFSGDTFEDLVALIGKEVKLTAAKGINNGLHQLVNVEEFVEIGEADLPQVLDLQTLDAWGSALAPHQSKLVTAKKLLVTDLSTSGSNNTTVTLRDEENNLTINAFIAAVFKDALADDYASALKVGYYVNVESVLAWFNNPQFAITKPGQMTLPEDLTNDEKATMALASINVPAAGNVMEDFELEQPKYFDAVIVWTVSEQDAIDIIDGVAVVTRQAEDTPVVLTYELKLGEAVIATDAIELIVVALGTENVTLEYTGSTTANMVAGENNAALVGLDPEVFEVITEKKSASNEVGLNANGTLRLYQNVNGGTKLTVIASEEMVITAIKFNFASTVARALIIAGEEELHDDTLVANSSLFFGSLSVNEFSIQNINPENTQIHINSIEITYKPAAPKPEYEVDFDLGYPEAEVLPPVLVTEGKKVAKPEDPEREGFVFLGWFLNDEEFDFETPITENIILVAKWEDASQMMNVTFMDGLEEYLVIPVVSGAKVEKPEDPVKEGFVFLGWFLNDEEFDFETPITENIILVAKWEEVEVPLEPTLLRESDFGETDGWGAYTLQSNKAIENGENDSEPDGSTSWDILGGNVNTTQWDYIRMGGKEASSEASPKVYLKTNFTFASQVTRIVINIVALDSAEGNETVYLQTSANGTDWVTVASKTTSVGDLEFDELNIAQGSYFRFVFGRESTSNNRGTDVKTISFYGPQA